jgi:hypothetical protein
MAVTFESLVVDLDRLSSSATFQDEVCARILELKSFALVERGEHRLEFSAPPSWKSDGETLHVDFEDGAIRIRSLCASAQWIDSGKNADNVEAVRRVVASMLRRGPR